MVGLEEKGNREVLLLLTVLDVLQLLQCRDLNLKLQRGVARIHPKSARKMMMMKNGGEVVLESARIPCLAWVCPPTSRSQCINNNTVRQCTV